MRPALILCLLLAGCSRAPAPELAIDHCALKEYLEDCDSELATPAEQSACRRRASQEAMRLLAGIPAECRGAAERGSRP